MESSTHSIDETLRDAAYAAVGIGVIAYHWSKPYRRQLAATVDSLQQEHGEACKTELKRGAHVVQGVLRDLDQKLFSRQ